MTSLQVDLSSRHTNAAAITRGAHCLLAPRQMGKSLSFLGETAAEGYPIVLS